MQKKKEKMIITIFFSKAIKLSIETSLIYIFYAIIKLQNQLKQQLIRKKLTFYY